ncbi:MAG: hypothetical protein OEZ02_11295 [Anaerolineae bacterium]|nr:hypothetical protein [Anaerolineae bacterium]
MIRQMNSIIMGLIILIMTGCAPDAEFKPTAASPTLTVTNATTSSIPTISPELIIADFKIVKKCKQPKSGNQNTMSIGSLIIQSKDDHGFWIMEHTSLSPEIFFKAPKWVAVSPYDGTLNWFNNDYDTSKFYAEFYTPQGERLSVALPRSLYFNGWLADGRIRLGVPRAMNNSEKEDGSTVDEYYLLTPQTGEMTFHSINFPHRQLYYDNYVIYDPLSELVFMNNLIGTPENVGIMSLETEQLIWWTDQFIIDNQPEWQIDGSQVVYSADDEIFVVDRFGNLTARTLFKDVIDGEYRIKYSVLGSFSPNGRYIAFEISYGSNLGDNTFFYVFDSATNAIYDYCTKTRPLNQSYSWSPQSDQLAIIGENQSRITILDVNSGNNHNVLTMGEEIIYYYWVPWTLP